MKKIELHIKWARTGYTVAYKDGRTWRSYTGLDLTRYEAVEKANKLIENHPEKFLKNICDCGTSVFSDSRM